MPKARRPVRSGTSTGACVRRRPSSHRRQAIKDRLSFCRESPLHIDILAIASLCGRMGGWSSCLCVFVFATEAGGSGFADKRLHRDKWICVICGQSEI